MFALVDGNNSYASFERIVRPRLRGMPLACTTRGTLNFRPFSRSETGCAQTESMDTSAQQQIRRAGDDLVAWVANYNAYGRTYRQFWADYSVAAGAFDALARRKDLSADVIEHVRTVRDFPILLGFAPGSLAEHQGLDDLIIGKQFVRSQPS